MLQTKWHQSSGPICVHKKPWGEGGGDRDPRDGSAVHPGFHASLRDSYSQWREEASGGDARRSPTGGVEMPLGEGPLFQEKPWGPPLGQSQPYRGIDGEGPLPVACSDVEGEERVAPTVGVTGQDVGDEAGDRAILTDGDVHG